MKKLIPAHRWIKEVFPEGGVGLPTVTKWVSTGAIPGTIIDGKVFVDADRAAILLETSTVIESNSTPTVTIEKTAIVGNAKVAQIVQMAMTGRT